VAYTTRTRRWKEFRQVSRLPRARATTARRHRDRQPCTHEPQSAIDVGDLVRARALLDLLDVESRIAPIATLAARKSPR
jgi:hypothetical protein